MLNHQFYKAEVTFMVQCTSLSTSACKYVCIWASTCKILQNMIYNTCLPAATISPENVLFPIFTRQGFPTMGGSGLTTLPFGTAVTAFSSCQWTRKKFSVDDKDVYEISSFCSLYKAICSRGKLQCLCSSTHDYAYTAVTVRILQ